jgi:hypothetical protein
LGKHPSEEMKMKTCILLFGLLSMLSIQLSQAAVEITQDENYVYYKWKYGDMEDSRQLDLRNQFVDLVREKIKTMHLPSKVTDLTSSEVSNSMNALAPAISRYEDVARGYRTHRGMEAMDIVPSGVFVAIGVNTSITTVGVPVGAGASLMVDAAMAPVRVLTLEKSTGRQLSDHTELNADVGGLFQVGGGFSEAAGAAWRVNLGLIWGDMPNINRLIGGGFTMGVTADEKIPLLGGLGLTALTMKNADTGLRNLIIFGNRDMGPKAGAETHVVMYYFGDQGTVARWAHADTPDAFLGQNPMPTSTPSPTVTPVTPAPVVTAPVVTTPVTPAPVAGTPVTQAPAPAKPGAPKPAGSMASELAKIF